MSDSGEEAERVEIFIIMVGFILGAEAVRKT